MFPKNLIFFIVLTNTTISSEDGGAIEADGGVRAIGAILPDMLPITSVRKHKVLVQLLVALMGAPPPLVLVVPTLWEAKHYLA